MGKVYSTNPARVSSVNGGTGDVVIGGRNLIPGTSVPKDIGPKDNDYVYGQFSFTVGTLMANETYTLSADVKVTAGDVTQVAIITYDSSIKTAQSPFVFAPIVDGHIQASFKILRSEAVYLLIYSDRSGATSGKGITVSNLKLERGNVATGWSPAPEDILDRLDALEAASGITYEPPAIKGPEIIGGEDMRE